MTKSYIAPALVELGAVQQVTAALGARTRPDFSSFPQIPADQGSFDVCPNGQTGQC